MGRDPGVLSRRELSVRTMKLGSVKRHQLAPGRSWQGMVSGVRLAAAKPLYMFLYMLSSANPAENGEKLR
jgi:hypothetical protein